MNKTFYFFKEWGAGSSALFDNEAALKEFIKQYLCWYLDKFNETPIKGEDYEVTKLELNPNFEEWINAPGD